jgi:PAS domain S-box-containing protein
MSLPEQSVLNRLASPAYDRRVALSSKFSHFATEREDTDGHPISIEPTQLLKPRRTAALVSAVVELSSDAIVGKSLDGTILTWNSGAERVYGYSAPEVIGRSVSILLSPEHHDEMPEILERIKSGETIDLYETERLRKDGRRIQLSLTISPIRDIDRTITGVSSIGRDISQRKQAEAARQENEAEFRTLANSMPQMVCVCMPDGSAVYFSQLWMDYTGLTLEQTLGKGWNTSFHSEDRQLAWGAWGHAIVTGEIFRVECRLRAADGRHCWFLIRGVPMLDDAGAIKKWFVTCTDIEALKLVEKEADKLNEGLERRIAERTAELVTANKELEAFSYSVSHDLRSPLRTIDGFCQALLEDYADKLDVEGRMYLRRVRMASQRMDRLIDGMLLLSRTSRAEIRRTTVNMSTLAQTIALELQTVEAQRKVEFVIAPNLIVNADGILLRSLLENLLGNAWKYTGNHPEARIELGTLQQDGEEAYFVRDDGAGFDMTYASNLFGAFQRLHTHQEFEGTGIGLANAARIVRRHGGKIWAEGAAELGATFFFTVPAKTEVNEPLSDGAHGKPA